MRSMLLRAAEIRESEQQQIFDALDEIHARLSPLETLGSVRKRLSELPDRTEVSVLAERLDETLAKLEAQDNAIAGLGRAVDGLVDKLAKPFAQLDGRLDGVTGRFEGVAGRMDGLEDKLSHIHKRIDDVDMHLDKQDDKLVELPASVHGPVRERLEALETALRARVDEVDEGMHEHLDGTREALAKTIGEHGETVHGVVRETRESVQGLLGETRDSVHGKLNELAKRPAVDPTDHFDSLAERLERLSSRLGEVAGRLDTVEEDFASRIGELSTVVDSGMSKIGGSLADRPTADNLVGLVRKANAESEARHAGQLDEAMATFAELILGGGSGSAQQPPSTMPPRQQRRARKPGTNGTKVRDDKDEDERLAIEA
ncbi:hypothetical protein D5S17_10870 [Pseudonocardiaceae bacterium YIM PH 21723]|nr:hypothetical protein D5S17_10870 [Pseudonocardiaceae bacterium YIM PH 21723]